MAETTTTPPPLRAPLQLSFDYTRSTGPVVGAFVTGLRERRVIGARIGDGRVVVPPPEFDPATHDSVCEFVEVGTVGTVVSATRTTLDEAVASAWVLVRLDGADTPLLHVLLDDAEVATGDRVEIVWADDTTGSIHDIMGFRLSQQVSTTDLPQAIDPAQLGEPVAMITTPITRNYTHTASAEESAYLRALKEGRVIGGRSSADGKVYVPPRGADPEHGIPTTEEVELSDTGTVTTFCIVNVPFLGQQIKPPYVAAYVLLDGADIPFLHLILECEASEVRMGMRVQAKWRPESEWDYTLRNIEYFRPTGEPDADPASYAHHL